MRYFSHEYGEFLHQLWGFFAHSSPRAPLEQWGPISRWMDEKYRVLSLEENYAFVIDHFCESVHVDDFPNSTGLIVATMPRWLRLRYRDGCPQGDPSFAETGHIMLANGLGCLSPTQCLPKRWLSLLRENFVNRSKHLKLDDLFFPSDVCNIPFVERRGAHVLPYSSFRFGLYLDFLIERGSFRSGRGEVIMEIGAGWGGFAALVKGNFPATRYIVLDIATSSIFQMGLLHRLGYRRILSLGANATRQAVHDVLCCVQFDFLYISAQHIGLLPDDAVDVIVNFDSMIEMPPDSIELYLRHAARVSRSFYHVNRYILSKRLLEPRLHKYMLRSSSNWKREYSAVNSLQWRAPASFSKVKNNAVNSSGERYIEEYYRRQS